MSLPRGRPAALAVAVSALLGVAGCGGSDVLERPAHRPISVLYVTGDDAGPWGPRTTGLADGVKLAIAERDGLAGERAVSVAVVPTAQRDGDVVSAAIGGGRILRDSRTLAVLAAYSADDLPLAAPQLNGGELPLLQFGSGMIGLTMREAPGEPGRYEPSGGRLALRGVPSDAAVAKTVTGLAQFKGAQVVEGAGTGEDVERLAARIATAVGGKIRPGTAAAGNGPVIFVSGPGSRDRNAEARALLRARNAPVLLVDAADRSFAAAGFRGRSAPTFLLRRRLADPTTSEARAIRARERATFGRDGGDAVVAGYRAAKRILNLAARQPDRTIDRTTFAAALVVDRPQDPDYPSDDDGNATLGTPLLSELKNGRWTER